MGDERLAAVRFRPAQTGVRLSESWALAEWEDRARAEGSSLLGWLLGVEALSARWPHPRAVVGVRMLAAALGEGEGTARRGGAVFAAYDRMRSALQDPPPDPLAQTNDAVTRVYRQARMLTYLPYRAGFQRDRDAVPFSAEVALHAYVRVVVEWAVRWRGLTLATHAERRAARERYDTVPDRSRARRAEERQRAEVALPLIVGQDLRELLRLARVEAGEMATARSAPDLTDPEMDAAVDALLEQLANAVTFVVDDPTLTSMTAANIARGEFNEYLGGALQRLRVSAHDRGALAQQMLELVYAEFVAPAHRAREKQGYLPTAAEAERRFSVIRSAMGAFGSARAGTAADS